MNDSMRIYVACLSSYNAGKLHGEWIDCEGLDADDLTTEVEAMLASSPAPNVMRRGHECNHCGSKWTTTLSGDVDRVPFDCPKCNANPEGTTFTAAFGSAEEYAIHDHEGFQGFNVGEFSSLAEIAEFVELVEQHGDAARAAASFCTDTDDIRKTCEDRYAGEWSSLEEYAEDMLENCGMLDGLPENLRCYFDFQSFGRDLELGGDVTTARLNGTLHVFSC